MDRVGVVTAQLLIWGLVAALGAAAALGVMTMIAVALVWAEVVGGELIVYAAVAGTGALAAMAAFYWIIGGHK